MRCAQLFALRKWSSRHRDPWGSVLAAALALSAGPAVGQPCVAGLPVNGVLGGDVGPAPGGAFVEVACLELRDDSGVARSGEIARSGVPIPHALRLLDTAALAVVGPGGRRLAAQLDVLSRWGAPRDDAAAPIRWLEVAVPADLPANGSARYSVRHHSGLAPAADPFAASIVETGPGIYRVDTGLASFTLAAGSGALLESFAIDLDDDGVGPKTNVYTHAPGAGPRLVYDGSSGDVTLDTSQVGAVTVDTGGFEIVESGPVRVVVVQRGHFVDAAGDTSRCTAAGLDYEALGYTAVFAFERASRDLRLELQVRNECSDGQGTNWTDDTVTVREASWRFPFPLVAQVAWAGGDGPLSASSPGFAGTTEVAQRRGTGTAPLFEDWTRRARARRGAVDLEVAELFVRPLVALSDPTLTVAATMPWLRYREPQALRLDGTTLSLRLVSEDLRIGEGKGIWGLARVSLTPTALATAGQSLDEFLEIRRDAMRVELERGLLLWPGRGAVDAARILPPLGDGAPHTARNAYLSWLDTLHDETVRPGGQWDRNKTYGSQYWPDTGANDPFGVDVDFPNQSTAGMNYWDPAGVEALEFLATGEPRWLWGLALPVYWTQAFAAYLNTGFTSASNRNGLAVESGGPGCAPTGSPPFVSPCTADGTGGGHWHRSGGGSDDYTYAMSLELGYALRPSVALRDRFAQAGQTVVDRYDPATPELDREMFVDVIGPYRQVVQHFEMLANCAEFVPGALGEACHDRLLEVVGELARDNLAAGILCAGTQANGEILGPPAALPSQCGTPAQFQQNALLYAFLHRFYAHHRHAADAATQTTIARVRRALVEAPAVLYDQGLELDAAGVPVPFGDWAAALDCQLGNGGTTVTSCVPASDGDGIYQYSHNQPATVALLFQAHELDPSLDFCGIARAAYDDPALTGGPGEGGAFGGVGHFIEAGWWKGVAQMMQGVTFGLGGYDVCVDDPQADLAVSKTNGAAVVAAGLLLEYQITVTNLGPHDVRSATLVDVLDATSLDVASATFSCAPIGEAGDGTVCPLQGPAADLVAGVAFDLEAGDALRFVVAVAVLADASGTLLNTATVATPAGVVDAVTSNDGATDADPIGVCAAMNVVTVSGISATGVVEACVRIEADATVPSGVSLALLAPLVVLRAGFRVESGGELRVIGGLPLD